MKTRRTITWMAAVCAVTLAGAAHAAFAWGGGAEAALSDQEMVLGWLTCPNELSVGSGQVERMAGEVTYQIKAGHGTLGLSGFMVECNGTEIPVVVQQRGGPLPAKNAVVFVLGEYVEPTGDYPNGYISQWLRCPVDGSEGVDEDAWNEWLEKGGYEFAVENAFRQFAVIAENGKRMDALTLVQWLQQRTEGKDPMVTDPADILKFLEENQRSFLGQLWQWCLENKASVVVAIALVLALAAILAVVLFVNRPRCPRCGQLLRNCTCETLPPATCPRCGRPVSQCICQTPPPPQICPSCGLPVDQCRCDETQPICNGCGNPKSRCTCTQPPPARGVALRIDGVPLERSDATVVLSEFALKVTKGGESAGKTVPLPKMATVLGRDKGIVPGAFIFLDMSDRPALEKQCSRQYAKITVRGDTLDVEVVAKSGNDVRVDGQVMSAKGEVMQAKLGSHIALNPDWEFEVVSARV